MYKKLDQNALNEILETGIEEFAKHGLDRANINTIAKKAGVSVGVLYKYYKDKDDFFLSCVKHSLKLLDETMEEALKDCDDVATGIRMIVRGLIASGKKHGNYYVMYNEITSGSCQKYAKELAREIEGKTAYLYKELLEKAGQEGKVKGMANPGMFAFYFDNLLMMLQFSYSCDYYKERMKIYCGEDILKNENLVEDSFIEFMSRALGIE
ncbi:MAG: TetR/AcrR family transcriptional regulator [Lachnospiraceae bacterium]|nr:TetR/AcrR family transcriptional regulator [Lachnospiraceae bacterium]